MEGHLRKTIIGYGLILSSLLCWVASGTAVQLLERHVPDFQLGLLRYIGAMLCSTLLLCFNLNKRTDLDIPRVSYGHVILMGASTMAYNCMYFFGVAFVPLSHTSFTSICRMIVTTALMKVIFDKSVNIIRLISITGCVLGMVCLIQPWKDFTHGFTPAFIASTANNSISPVNVTSHEHLAPDPTLGLVFGYLNLFGAAVFDSFYLILAGVYLKGVKPVPLTFLTSGVAIFVSIICMFYLEQPVWITDPYDILLVSCHVVPVAVSILCQVAACQLLSPVQIAIVSTLNPVLNLISQYTILGHYLSGRKNVLEVVGCVVIVASIALSGRYNNEEKHEDFKKT